MPTLDERYNEAIQLKDDGKLQESAAMLEAITQEDDTFAIAFSALAVGYSQLGENEQAIAAAQRVCELEPDDPFSFTALSVTLQKSGQIPEAEAAMAKAHQLHGR